MHSERLLFLWHGNECFDEAISVNGPKLLQRLLVVRELDGAVQIPKQRHRMIITGSGTLRRVFPERVLWRCKDGARGTISQLLGRRQAGER